MAKQRQAGKEAASATEQRIEDFAEDLGRLLGSAQAKAQGWIGQRQTIAKHLEEIRDTASGLLTQLGIAAAGLRRGARRGRSQAAGGGVRRRRKLSPEARARIADAQRRRWAAFRAAKRK